jgi:Adenylate and Guanylate cyclase catalytic domain
MASFAQIERSIVAIFDIEEFSDRTQEAMAQLVEKFLDLLSIHIEQLNDLQPDSFSTGDGAIVSIGRQCHIDAKSTTRFLEFTINLASALCTTGVIVRTAINYSENDRIVFGKINALKGQYIQVGDTINVAARVITFAEPREIIVTDSVQRLLRSHDLLMEYELHHNEILITKHGLKLDTYTYIPNNKQVDDLYNPSSPLHCYKRFSAFPPLKSRTLNQFVASGMDIELCKVVSNAYDAMRYINETKTFISTSEVMEVLTMLHYDPNDSVYVISRNDRPTNFWTQKRRNTYLEFLKGKAKRYGGNINQTRIIIYDLNLSTNHGLMPEDAIFFQFQELHKPKSFANFPINLLSKFNQMSQLIFGFTLSKKYKFAIIPVPSAEFIDATKLKPENLGELLQLYRNYDVEDGPMKAIITADEHFIDKLIIEFENLLDHSSLQYIK